ncbi:MAG: hypothetical protein IPN20_03270 [Haliscomenobacter sp.]|nr:hypothetical protein [Haliscomenobacter sp.]
MSFFLKDLRKAVGQNRLEFVFSQIKSSLYSFLSEDKMVLTEQQELIEKITILEARWDQINSGVTSKSEEETKKLQIINSLLQLINENTLDDNYPNYFNFIKTFKHGQSEDENWLDACTRNDIEGYTSYLKEYSEGKFSMHAKHLIEKLNNAFVNNPIQQGAVIYGKIRGYLMLEPHLQEEFNNIIEKSILGPYLSYSSNIKLIFITGGTFAVFFEKEPNEKSTFTSFKAFLFGILCQLEAKKNEFNIGIAIHWEDDPRIKVVGRYCYIYNIATDLAKHYMSFSDKDHFFISTQIKEKLSKIIFDSLEKPFAVEKDFISYLNSRKASYSNKENDIINILLRDIEVIYYSLTNHESNPPFFHLICLSILTD